MTTGTAHIVVVGPRSGAADDGLGPLMARLAAWGVTVTGRSYVDDEAALENVLGLATWLTVIVASPVGAAAAAVRRALARLAGARLSPNEQLGLAPDGAAVWATAESEPAWLLEIQGRSFMVLPRGANLEPILTRHLMPYVTSHHAGPGSLAHRTLRTAGVTFEEIERRLGDRLGEVTTPSGTVEVSVVPAEGDMWIRLRARGSTTADAEQALAVVDAAVAAALGPDCYGRDGDSLERVVAGLLLERKLTLAVAESCTGGLLGHRLTNVPGSSAYFDRGVMVYSNRAKQELLGVPEDVLRQHGAVSGPCAEAMARGVVAASGAGCGLAVTGIAGPDGGTAAKPVGTVFVGVAMGDDVTAHRFHFTGDRASIKWQSSQVALDLLRRRLLADR